MRVDKTNRRGEVRVIRGATKPLLALAGLFTFSDSAVADVRVELADSITQTSAKQPASHARWTRRLEIDGPRFRIVSPDGVVETSLDDGATTFFGTDRTKSEKRLPTSPISPKGGEAT
jgi:hypothetical protein